MLSQWQVLDDSIHCNQPGCDTIFIVSNLASKGMKNDEKTNPAKSFVFHNFLEAVLRLAIGKYIKQERTEDIAEAIDLLVKEHIMVGTKANPAAVHDTDRYRTQRVYVEGVDEVLKENEETLKQIYLKFSPKTVDKGMMRKEIEMSETEWMGMLADIEFIDNQFTQREATLAFVWCRHRVVDDSKDYMRHSHLGFYVSIRNCSISASP
jgi:hypothetical protein